jgi:ABC-type Co2+ transport system permease subunit
MDILAVGICWDLRRRLWFWCVIALILALHVPLVLLIQWPDRWVSRFTLLPIGIADPLITVGIVRFVEKFIVKSPPPDEEA